MRLFALSFVALASAVIACGGGSESGTGEAVPAPAEGAGGATSAGGEPAPAMPGDVPGRFQARLVDAPTSEVKEIVVTVTKVTAHSTSGGWQTIGNLTKTIDLLKLQNGTFTSLGVAQWPAGTITQFRLYVSEAGPNYVTTPDGAHHPLTVPSGEESGIKFKGGFKVDGCSTGFVTFDFDGKKSIFTHPKGAGAGDEWLLRPVVRLKSLVYRGKCSDLDGGTATGGGSGGSAGGSADSDGGASGSVGGDGGASGTSSGDSDAGAPSGSSGGETYSGGGATGTAGGEGSGGATGEVLDYGDVKITDLCGNVTCPSDLYCSNGVCAMLL